jgi:hypothetical protein
MTDRTPEQVALELLPCRYDWCRLTPGTCSACTARPAVAAALRERDEEIKRLTAKSVKYAADYMDMIQERNARPPAELAERMAEALHDMLTSPTEFDDDRMDYATRQVSKLEYQEAEEALEQYRKWKARSE